MTRERLLKEFRGHWINILNSNHDYRVGFSILHGLLERVHPEQYNDAVELYFRNSKELLEKSTSKKSDTILILKKSLESGLQIPILGTEDVNLSLQNLCQVDDIRGYFGYIDEVDSSEGKCNRKFRIVLYNESSQSLNLVLNLYNDLMDRTHLPEDYKRDGVGICWVEYTFIDKRKPVGNLQPGSDVE
jgi:hypothetical protein